MRARIESRDAVHFEGLCKFVTNPIPEEIGTFSPPVNNVFHISTGQSMKWDPFFGWKWIQ